MKLLSTLICVCVSSMAYAYPGWEDAVVLEKANTCANILIKNGNVKEKAWKHCACFVDYTASRLTEKELVILQNGAPDTFTRFMDKAWQACNHNLK